MTDPTHRHGYDPDDLMAWRQAQDDDDVGNLLYRAWAVIANVGDITNPPDTCSPGWSEAAIRWRDDFHRWLDKNTQAVQ